MFSPLQKDTTRLELNFTMHSYSSAPRPCLWNYYLEIRDGNSQSANVLGVFCGDHKTAVVRSIGRYLWLNFSLLADIILMHTTRESIKQA